MKKTMLMRSYILHFKCRLLYVVVRVIYVRLSLDYASCPQEQKAKCSLQKENEIFFCLQSLYVQVKTAKARESERGFRLNKYIIIKRVLCNEKQFQNGCVDNRQFDKKICYGIERHTIKTINSYYTQQQIAIRI